MMDYTAGQSRSQGNAVESEQGAVASVNQGRPHIQAGGSVHMNISTGGPHILLFERDQQFATLLGSELQLAGFECHTARTAVEVFDAIARYSIRLVLVNLAQAAAARREFWVALDTQRRGRGVQVLTFHCANLAGYGPLSDDPDDRSHIMLADLEVDGMLGLVNMVNAIRSRIAASTNGTGARPVSNAGIDARQQSNGLASEGSKVSQTTMPLPAASASDTASSRVRSVPTPPAIPNSSSPQPVSSAAEASQPPRPAVVHHTDKIRAVIYPNQRSWNTQRDAEGLQGPNDVGNGNQQQNQVTLPVNGALAASSSSERQARNEGTSWQGQNQPEQKESGLAQLSRMVQEHRMPLENGAATNNGQNGASLPEITMPQQRVRPAEATAISAQPLRASPIEDLPNDRHTGNSRNAYADAGGTAVRVDSAVQGSAYQTNSAYSAASTLASIALPTSTPPIASLSLAEPAAAVAPMVKQDAVTPPLTGTSKNDEQAISAGGEMRASAEVVQAGRASGSQEQRLAEQLQAMLQEQTQTQIQLPPETEQPKPAVREENSLQNIVPVQSQEHAAALPVKAATDNALLLDIVQSLPPMPSPPPQQMLSGRATRSLGSVLLEGHLVPRDRLEVALGIQRMLRGVDMNYQLGEILLMFKLLTPDQLLAASLVSYGLITTTQISALGRIRQELHSIGLEYDLENLLILFRILTSEQLREVRSSWSS